jgi:hypothetical protein
MIMEQYQNQYIKDTGNTKPEINAITELLRLYPDTEADGIVFCGKCGNRR